MIKRFTHIIFILLLAAQASAQTVGVVLSGGGASGMSHVGVLKALEENKIPIDYIVGTSAGALVASLYASGYSPEEIEAMLASDDFLTMALGKIKEEDEFYYKKSSQNASIIGLNFDKNFSSESFIPTNYTFPNLLDFNLLKLYGKPQTTNFDFDSLFIPYRCVSADVSNNKAHVFKNGNINEAVRSSMTYPFYMKPIRVDGRYMYDGGLYNNFPSDVLYDDFLPDVIIGSDLADSSDFQNDDFFSQLKNIVLNRKNNDIKCENGIIIEPKTSVGTFDFDNAQQAFEDGYNATIKHMDSIKSLVDFKQVDLEELNNKRAKYRIKHFEAFLVDSIYVSSGASKNQTKFIKHSLLKKGEKISMDVLYKRYFRLVEDENITHIFPKLQKNPKSNDYILVLDVSLQKDFGVEFGGVFSSSPINTGFVGVNFRKLGKASNHLSLNSYFGKLYGSVKGQYIVDIPHRKLPFKLMLSAGINRYDFFKSYATFFEDVKPSFIVQNEFYSRLNAVLPLSNKSNISAEYENFFVNNQYYQAEDFTNADTTDVVNFFGNRYGAAFSQNSLNEKAFATRGSYWSINPFYVKGKETNTPGSTSLEELPFEGTREWFKVIATAEHYFAPSKNFSFGVYANTVLSSNYEFSNFFSTLLFSSQFEGINQLRTIYSEGLRSNNFVALGIKPILVLKNNLQWRNELFGYSPIFSIRNNQFNQPTRLNQMFLAQNFVGKSSLVYTSPFGPISLSLIYLQPEPEPFFIQFNFGYIIHNKRVLD